MSAAPARIVAIALLLGALAAAGCARAPVGGARVRAANGGAPLVQSPATAAGIRAMARRPGAAATLVNVWATWCEPCRKEFQQLVRVMVRHPDVRFVLVSTDFADQRREALKFLGPLGVQDSTYFKAEGDQAFIDGLDPRWSGSLPATLVYDAQGRPVAFWEGAADSLRFEAAIAKAVGADVPTTR